MVTVLAGPVVVVATVIGVTVVGGTVVGPAKEAMSEVEQQ